MLEHEITSLLADWQGGDDDALERLAPHIYQELKRVAASYLHKEHSANTLQTTALVHEVYLRLNGVEMNFENRSHFFALAARMMRRILVDHARGKQSIKRGGGARQVTFDEAALVSADNAPNLLEIDSALSKLARFDPRMAKAIELRFFGGLSHAESAVALEISDTTLYEDLKLAKTWLRRELA